MQLANDFRVQYGNDLQPELITELLRSLNKIWREREKKTIQRLKVEYSEKIATTRRIGNGKIGWDSLTFKKSLANLSMKLNQVQKQLRAAQEKLHKSKQEPVLETELIDTTLQAIVQIQNEKKAISNKNEELVQKVQQL